MPDGDVSKELREALAVVLAGGADDPETATKKATELMARAKQASGVGFTAAVDTGDGLFPHMPFLKEHMVMSECV